jgi:hypothetical protein
MKHVLRHMKGIALMFLYAALIAAVAIYTTVQTFDPKNTDEVVWCEK